MYIIASILLISKLLHLLKLTVIIFLNLKLFRIIGKTKPITISSNEHCYLKLNILFSQISDSDKQEYYRLKLK